MRRTNCPLCDAPLIGGLCKDSDHYGIYYAPNQQDIRAEIAAVIPYMVKINYQTNQTSVFYCDCDDHYYIGDIITVLPITIHIDGKQQLIDKIKTILTFS